MKTIVEALKDLYVALGGKEQDVASLLLNPDVIEKIAAVAGDAVKPELPSLTGNAGKVLKVDADAEGVEWGEAGGGGGGLTLYGPYYATAGTTQTVPADGVSHMIDLTAIYDSDFLGQVELPSIPAKYPLYSYSIGSPDLTILGVSAPDYYDGEIHQPYILFFNKTESPITVSSQTVFVCFYSDTELQSVNV